MSYLEELLPEFRNGAEKGANWKNCRPVRRDEVNFYEDKND